MNQAIQILKGMGVDRIVIEALKSNREVNTTRIIQSYLLTQENRIIAAKCELLREVCRLDYLLKEKERELSTLKKCQNQAV